VIEVPVEQVTENVINLERANLNQNMKTVTRQVPVVRTVEVPVEYEVLNFVEKPTEKEIEKTVY